jgi:hypothetical protein
MAKLKGSPKTGGRVKGTPNKSTKVLGELIKSYDYDPVASLLNKYDHLSIEEQTKIDLKLLEYIYPKFKSVELHVDDRKENPFKDMTLEEMRAEHERLSQENRKTFEHILKSRRSA